MQLNLARCGRSHFNPRTRFPLNLSKKRFFTTHDPEPTPARETSLKSNITTVQLRESFLSYFEKQGHLRLPSSNLAPENDQSLLFTSAGMVQFKDYFLDRRQPPSTRITTAQKCLRIGGKHCDLENIGKTNRHQTFFEMLGNFSFGDYTKGDAMHFALEYLTKEVGMPQEKLAVSVLEGDDEARFLWKQLGFPDERIMDKGPEDNFWMMSNDSGPCGPCTEIFYDQEVEVDGDRFLEIWNLVFMQYEQSVVDGKIVRAPLKRLCIDTGMGLERLTSVVQGVESNFDIDCMLATKSAISTLVNYCEYPQISEKEFEVSIRVIVDHLRALILMLAEGILPGIGNRGQILGQLIRRASFKGKKLELSSAFLHYLAPIMIKEMGGQGWFPELSERKEHIIEVLKNEERKWLQSLAELENRCNLKEWVYESTDLQHTPKRVDGQTAYDLTQLLSFQIDVIQAVFGHYNFIIDMDEYAAVAAKKAAELKQKFQVSGEKAIEGEFLKWERKKIFPKFVGYNNLSCTTSVSAGWIPPNQTPNEQGLFFGWISPAECPFYAEAGGQVGDIGFIEATLEGCAEIVKLPVVGTIHPYPNGYALKVQSDSLDQLEKLCHKKTSITCHVDQEFRSGCAQAHTATHLLHAALKEVVSPTIVQAGSKVECEVLRFDFVHNSAIDLEVLYEVENWVYGAIFSDAQVGATEMPYKKAIKEDAVCLFSEKYPEVVRVVDIDGRSKELCCGTHVQSTGSITAFKILSETGLGTGRRRITAVVGKAAIDWFRKEAWRLSTVTTMLNSRTTAPEEKVNQLLQERVALRAKNRQLEIQKGELEAKIKQLESDINASDPFFDVAIGQYKGVKFRLHEIKGDADMVMKAQQLIKQEPNIFHLLLRSPMIHGACDLEDVHCGNLFREIVQKFGGKGGGGKKNAQGSFVGSEAEKASVNIRELLGISTHWAIPPDMARNVQDVLLQAGWAEFGELSVQDKLGLHFFALTEGQDQNFVFLDDKCHYDITFGELDQLSKRVQSNFSTSISTIPESDWPCFKEFFEVTQKPYNPSIFKPVETKIKLFLAQQIWAVQSFVIQGIGTKDRSLLTTLDHVIGTPILLELFTEYLIDVLGFEVLDFYLACLRYETFPSAARPQQARIIWEAFFTGQKGLQIDVDFHTRREVKNGLIHASIELFNTVKLQQRDCLINLLIDFHAVAQAKKTKFESVQQILNLFEDYDDWHKVDFASFLWTSSMVQWAQIFFASVESRKRITILMANLKNSKASSVEMFEPKDANIDSLAQTHVDVWSAFLPTYHRFCKFQKSSSEADYQTYLARAQQALPKFRSDSNNKLFTKITNSLVPRSKKSSKAGGYSRGAALFAPPLTKRVSDTPTPPKYPTMLNSHSPHVGRINIIQPLPFTSSDPVLPTRGLAVPSPRRRISRSPSPGRTRMLPVTAPPPTPTGVTPTPSPPFSPEPSSLPNSQPNSLPTSQAPSLSQPSSIPGSPSTMSTAGSAGSEGLHTPIDTLKVIPEEGGRSGRSGSLSSESQRRIEVLSRSDRSYEQSGGAGGGPILLPIRSFKDLCSTTPSPRTPNLSNTSTPRNSSSSPRKSTSTPRSSSPSRVQKVPRPKSGIFYSDGRPPKFDGSTIQLPKAETKLQSLEFLVSHVILETLDPSIMSDILVALPHFMNPHFIIPIIYQIYSFSLRLDTQHTLTIPIQVSNLLKQLISLLGKHFFSHPAGAQLITDLIDKMRSRHTMFAACLQDLFATELAKSSLTVFEPQKKNSTTDVNLLNCNLSLLAQQMSIFDQKNFQACPLPEFHKANWTKPHAAKKLNEIAAYQNGLVHRLAAEIIQVQTTRMSLPQIIALLKLGSKLLKMSNFESLRAIDLVFSTRVSQLTKSIKLLPRKWRAVKDHIDAIFSPNNNYLKYRTMLAQSPRHIPCREIGLQHMLFFQSGPRFVGEPRANLNTTQLLAIGKLISDFILAKQQDLTTKPEVYSMLQFLYSHPQQFNEEFLSQLSHEEFES